MVRSQTTKNIISFSIAAGLLLLGTPAFAQSVTLVESSINRTNSFRKSTQEPMWISYADCINNDAFTFPLTLGGSFSNYTLEVWVGSSSDDCQAQASRTTATQVCWKVWEGVPDDANTTIMVPVRNIVSRDLGTTSVGSYDESICEETSISTSPHNVGVYFMFISDGASVGGYKWETAYDLAGPVAPTNVEVGVGDGLLVLDWKDKSKDKVSYKFFCDPAPGEEDVSTGGGPLDGEDASADAMLDSMADGNTESDTETNQESGAEASKPEISEPTACETSILSKGANPPDSKYECGSGTGLSGRVTGLVNGVSYSVAIAGVDTVGNVGKLSVVGCETPTIVNDFYRVYRDAGGQAGGGFCNTSGGVGHVAGVSGLLLIAMAAIGGSLRRRSR